MQVGRMPWDKLQTRRSWVLIGAMTHLRLRSRASLQRPALQKGTILLIVRYPHFLVAGFRVAVPALLRLPAEAAGFNQHILRISKLLLPLVAKPAKVGPVPLLALCEPLDQFEVDLGAVLFHDHAEGFHGWCPKPSFSSCRNWPRIDHVGRSLKALASSRSAAQKAPASGPSRGNPDLL
jgi:hypothetical protein